MLNEETRNELSLIQDEMNDLTRDAIQHLFGADFGTRTLEDGPEIDVFEEKTQRFQYLHNRMRELLRKEPRKYKRLSGEVLSNGK